MPRSCPATARPSPSVTPWAAENAARLAEIRATVKSVLGTADDAAGILKLTADRLGLAIGNPVTYCLTQTTILACLSSLQKAGEASRQRRGQSAGLAAGVKPATIRDHCSSPAPGRLTLHLRIAKS